MARSLWLFLHVTSAMGMIAALGTEGMVLNQFRRATGVADVKAALNAFRAVQWVGGPSLILTLVSGIYLATTFWSWHGAWMSVTFASVFIAAAIGGAMTGRRIVRLRNAVNAAGSGAADRRLYDHPRDPVLAASFVIRVAILIGIVFLMTVKPGLQGSLVAMAVAIAVGIVASLSSAARARTAVAGDARGATP